MITSTLVKMLSYCNNVKELRLPPGTKLNCKQLDIILSMKQLEKLEILLSSDFKPLLEIGRLRELTVHAEEKKTQPFCMLCVKEWVAKGFIPCNLSIVVHTYNLNIVEHEFAEQLQKSFLESWRQWNSTIPVSHTAYLKLYNNNRSPLNISPIFPTIHFEFSQKANLPFVKLSDFGVLGLERDFTLLTHAVHDGKTVSKAKVMAPDEFSHVITPMLNSGIRNLSCVTDFDFVQCQFLHSGHLEQLAIACPNIQRLNLGGNTECLSSLQGLRMIVQCCEGLRGLNLRGIPLGNIANNVQLWDLLSRMKKLTYLAFQVCLFGVSASTNLQYVHNLCRLFWKFSNLEGLEFHLCFGFCWGCLSCEAEMRWVWVFLSSFQSLRHCKFDCDDPDSVQDVIADCEQLTCLHCHCEELSLSSVFNSNLQQLSISSVGTDIPDVFLETVSAHRGLVHVGFGVNSVKIEGITSLIENSPKLLTLVVYTCETIRNEQGLKVNLIKFKSNIKKSPCQKLFTVGTYKIVQNNESAASYLEDYIPRTDLASLWIYN